MSAATGLSTNIQDTPGVARELPDAAQSRRGDVRKFLRRALIFVLIGLVLYGLVYAWSERLVYGNTVKNRFFTVKTAPLQDYDYVILGASHAYAMDYDDSTARLEEMTGAKVLNLSSEGAGVTVSRVFLNYFLARHRTRNVIYLVDSFAFYTAEWNEDRIKDTRLYNRAPFDLRLAWQMLLQPATRPIALDYIFGFAKINNAERFANDITEEEATKFDKVYRPVAQIDKQRITYLYPEVVDKQLFDRYMAELEAMIKDLQKRGVTLIVAKPPIPKRMYDMIPGEADFDARLTALLSQYGVEFHDFSLVMDDNQYYFNSDHLNRTGVLYFFENFLKGVMAG